ncbi:MAG: Lytic transglycosylase [Candidatus Tokpelaia sp. JSC161]|jgi:hypothetical protein|nr:MAG: Lytic transglycosylase [Candidatus Tokpelaia sp. JSC161]
MIKKTILLAITVSPLLIGCASTPKHIDNACAVLNQNDGIFFNWQKAVQEAEKNYSIPIPIILATIYTESSFKQRAKPPRTKLLGFIPWKHLSTAYGYSQALNTSWEDYRKKTGHATARRTNFYDAAQFVAWFHHESVRKNHISPNDAYNLYLNYHMGHYAYIHQKISSTAAHHAEKMKRIAQKYKIQLRKCNRL